MINTPITVQLVRKDLQYNLIANDGTVIGFIHGAGDAEIIKLAVNAHDELVEALKSCENFISYLEHVDKVKYDVGKIARTILARIDAEGGGG